MAEETVGQPIQPEITTVKINNTFFGPFFVSGLAAQTNPVQVVDENTAVLPAFQGGLGTELFFNLTLFGEGFGVGPDGRFTGTIKGYKSEQVGEPDNSWEFINLSTPLDIFNSQVTSPEVTFPDLLVVPLRYRYLGSDQDDTYILGAFDDIARGGNGADTFNGLTGNDSLVGQGGKDTLNGEEGTDTLRGGDGADSLSGGEGDDFLKGNDGGDEMSGGGDDDILIGGNGADTMNGGAGADEMSGGRAADVMNGDGGKDDMIGGDGADTMDGGGGSDVMGGGVGRDEMSGGAGDDIVNGGKGADTIDGGVGSDTLSGGASGDEITGGQGADVIFGNDGNDSLSGGGATDELFGGAGNDTLEGGATSDFIVGGEGDDLLSGNITSTPTPDFATDFFVFSDEFGTDIITDFETGFDLILLSDLTEDQVSVIDIGDDVLITAATGAGQILVENAAANFNADINILFG
ncbi:MAG: calcium-binding protein [Devosia sp.]